MNNSPHHFESHPLYTSTNKIIRGDLIKSAVLRSDMSPVPVTLEAEITVDNDLAVLLAEGKTIKTSDDDIMRIVKSTLQINSKAPGVLMPTEN